MTKERFEEIKNFVRTRPGRATERLLTEDLPALVAEVERLIEQRDHWKRAYEDSRQRIREMEQGIMF